MTELLKHIHDFFSSTGVTVRRSCDELIAPLMNEHGFVLTTHYDDTNMGEVIYRRGDQWIRLDISKHIADFPGDVSVNLGVGSSDRPESEHASVSIEQYIAAKTTGHSSISAKADVETIVAAVRKNLEEFAMDFLNGDLGTYNLAHARKGKSMNA